MRDGIDTPVGSANPATFGVRALWRLLAPVLFPTWRFFDSIGPAPRLLVARLGDQPIDWADLTMQPSARSVTATLRALLHDPERNAALFWVSLCERVLASEGEQPLLTLHAFLRRWAKQMAWPASQPLVFRIVTRDPALGWGDRLAYEGRVALATDAAV